jgi:hypothetical protein
MKKRQPKTIEQTKITKTSQILGLLREDKNLECCQCFPTSLFLQAQSRCHPMTYMPILNGCQAQETFALPGLISLTFPALRPKPWDLLEIQQQQLKLDSGLQPCFLYHCLLLKGTLTTCIYMLSRPVEVKPSLCLHLAMNTDTY